MSWRVPSISQAKIFRCLQQLSQSVGQLNLTRPIARSRTQCGKDVGRQQVAADDGEVRRRLVAWRLFDEIADRMHAFAQIDRRIDVDDAVIRDLFGRYSLDGEDRPADSFEHFNHLFQCRWACVDDVVCKNDGEGLVADQIGGDEHRMTEAEWLALTHVGDVDHVGDLANLLEQVELAALLKKAFELDVDVEMIFDGVLATSGHDDDVLDAGLDGLFDAILNDGLVDEGQHFLRLCFGGGKESRAEPGGGEHDLANSCGHGAYSTEIAPFCAPAGPRKGRR